MRRKRRPPRGRNSAGEFRTAKNLGYFLIDCGRQAEDVDFFSVQEGTFGNAIRLERSAYDSGCVEDDQPDLSGLRRSEL